MNKLLIITGVSASGKTSLQDELLKRLWVRPINFTTRKPRSEKELDEYVFLDKNLFFEKLKNGDFLEYTNYNGNWYGISSHLPNGNVSIILDPSGREQVLEKIKRNNIQYDIHCIYLEITKKLQEERLKKRGDTKQEIKNRKKDFEFFNYNSFSRIYNGAEDIKKLADTIECEILKKT